MSKFGFIQDEILRTNVNIAFEYILNLTTIQEDPHYNTPNVINSLRKTVLIYTVSIIEAILIYILKNKLKFNTIRIPNEWRYSDPKVLYKIDEDEQVIGCIRKSVQKQINKIDLYRIIDISQHKNIISNSLAQDLHRARILRNNLHIGTLSTIDKGNSNEDLEFIFSIAKRVKGLGEQLL